MSARNIFPRILHRFRKSVRQSANWDSIDITPSVYLPIKRRTLPAALFLFTATVAAACSGKDSSTVTAPASPASPASTAQPSQSITARIAWLKSPSVLALSKFNGEMEKALTEKGIKVLWEGPFPAFSPVVEAINAGSVDFTVGSSTSAVSAMAGDVPLKVFAYQKNVGIGEGIVAQGKSSIRTVKDLVGKKVAVNRGGTGEYLLVKALEQENIPLDQVERVYLGPRDAAPAFAQGQVDAWAVWGIFLATAEVEHGGRIIATGEQIGSENDSIFVVRNEFLEQYPDVVKAVFDVLKTQSEWADKNRAAAVEIYAKEFELSDGVKKALENRFDGVIEPVDAAQTQRIGKVANWFFDKGVIPKKPDAAAFTVDVSK
ncbi:MAG: aliphatic sulfonate ABC transporter substrate-binding protein [Elainella sp. C42_A2020_010]|nr:aliphatic sulfonate ABC transporter substrate-binding protein [Elainella sp. C42_A2020_010]